MASGSGSLRLNAKQEWVGRLPDLRNRIRASWFLPNLLFILGFLLLLLPVLRNLLVQPLVLRFLIVPRVRVLGSFSIDIAVLGGFHRQERPEVLVEISLHKSAALLYCLYQHFSIVL